jgi:signal transduction histidine kinase
MTFVFSDSERRYNETHVEVAEELGRRCALAFENSTLYQLSQAAIAGRDEFLSIASHELNTPITSLKLHLQMTKKALSQGPISSERFLKSLDASLKQVDRLIALIEVLLDVSRIQAGKLNLNFERFDLVDVTRELSERFKEVLSSNECLLTIKAPEQLWVNWDRMRIEQVLANLLTNAIKYAPGKIDLILSNDSDLVKIEMKDYGEGIAQEKLSTIFERFERASSNRSIGGLGLGLFIVKQILDGHDGRIDVQSGPQDGSKFILNLPSELPFH